LPLKDKNQISPV